MESTWSMETASTVWLKLAYDAFYYMTWMITVFTALYIYSGPYQVLIR